MIVDGVKKFQEKKFVENYDVDYLKDYIDYGNWYRGDKKTYRNTAFKDIKRLFPFDDITLKNGYFNIKLNSEINVPDWFEKLYLNNRESFYDWYYETLLKYTESYLKIISPKVKQITVGITGGFDSRLTLSVLSKLAPKYNIKVKSLTYGLPEHPDVIIGEKVANYLNVDWVNEDQGENKLKYYPSSLPEYASTFYIGQGDFDSHNSVREYSREYDNITEFYQHGVSAYKRVHFNYVMDMGRWLSRRLLYPQEFYFPLFATNLEIWSAFLCKKYSEYSYKEFIYNVLKRIDEKLLEMPFALDSLPQTGVEEFKVEGYVDSRHKQEPFLWDYNFVLDKLDPLLKEQFQKQDEKYNLLLSKSGINSLDYFILTKKIDKILSENESDEKIKQKLIRVKKKTFYPTHRDFIDLKKYKKITQYNKLLTLSDFAATCDFNSFESLEKACSFNMEDHSLELLEKSYIKINDLIMDNDKLEDKLKSAKKLNNEIINSKSWKLTKPLREIKYFFHR